MTHNPDFSRVIAGLDALVEAETLVARAEIAEKQAQDAYLRLGRTRQTETAFSGSCVRRAVLANTLSELKGRLEMEITQVASDARYAALVAAAKEGSKG